MKAPKKRKSTTKEMLGRLQDLIGNAKGVYGNDRDVSRADKLYPILDEAFRLVLEIRSRRKP
jgi:hypothetical protein